MASKLRIDGFKIYEFTPTTFTALSRNAEGLIAAARSDGSLDVYDERDNFYLLHRFPSSVLVSVCSVCWFDGRLFAAGGEGRIFELDLPRLTVKTSLLLPGGLPCRCMAADKNHFVGGNDGGYVCTIATQPGALEIKNVAVKLEGKVLSLAVDAEKHKVIAVGDSLGKVHLINIDSCSVFSTFCLDAESSVLPTVVWSLLFVGGVLFSGDSKGRVSLWNIKVGGMICSFASHNADVLALAASPDSMSVFAGGVDPIIRRFDFSHSGSSARWQAGGLIHGCQRDIHGLVYIPRDKTGGVVDGGLRQVDRLLAAGDDGRLNLLACSSTSDLGVDAPLRAQQTPAAQVGQPRGEKSSSIASIAALPLWPLSLAPSLPVTMQFARETFLANNGSSSPPARLGLLQYADHMNLIHFPRRPKTFFKKTNEANDEKNRNFLCLAEIRPRRGQQVLTCAISPCGRFVAYSDTTRSRVLKVAHPESWLFDRNCPSQLVTISRLGWANLGSERKRRRRSISRASSEERSVGAAASTPTTGSGGTSELDSDSDEGRLFLDQSSADLFTAASNGLPDTELANVAPTAADKKRPSSAMVPADQTDDSSALPAARLLAFTPDSTGLVSIDTATQQVTYLDLQTGCERWRFTPGASAPVGVHLMRMEKFALKLSSTKESPNSHVTFLALGCVDGRVLLHCLETGGQHLFTCPRIHSDSSLCAPRPVAVAFRTPTPSSKSSSPARLDLRLSILYTSSQLVEWQVPISVESGAGKFKVSVREHPVQDPWLLKFWASVGKEWNRRLPPFHSMDYLGPSGDCWILVSAGFVVYLDRTKPYKASDVKVAIRRQSKEADDLCLKVSTKFQTAIQASVLPDRVAIMQIDMPEILLKLPAPLHKKRFGT